MPGPSLVQRQADSLKTLARVATERATRETKIELDFAKDKATAERQYQSARQGIVRRRDMQVQAIEGEIGTIRGTLDQAYQKSLAGAKTERDQKIAHAKKRFTVETEAAETALEEAGWETGALFDANIDKVNKKTEQYKARLNDSLAHLDAIREPASHYVETYKKYITLDPERPKPEFAEAEGPIPKLDAATNRIIETFEAGTKLKILPIVKLDFFIFLCVVLFAALAIGLGLVVGWMIGPLVALAVTAVASFVVRKSIVSAARKQITEAAAPMAMALADAEHLAELAYDWIQENAKRLRARADKLRDDQNAKHQEHHDRLIPELKVRHDADIKGAEDRYPKALADAAKKYEVDLGAAEDKYKKELAEARTNGETELQELDARHFAEVEARQNAYEAAWRKLIDDWRNAINAAKSELDATTAESDRMFLPWHSPAWDPWTPPTELPPVLRFGEVTVPMKQIPQGVPEDPRLKEFTPASLALPAFLQFPDKISLLIKAADEGRAPAVQLLQATMLRFLTAIPPGKVRFTIVDPVGLGQNFSTFMNLKDADELLVTNRIWTESPQIDQRLLDLTEHMENVIQTYLRNEYASIEEYNVMAGEVAEPYRVLVAANYPSNFSDSAQRRLVSIAQSGPRCGVYVLVSLDPKLAHGTSQLAKDLEPSCVNVLWKENRFIWKDSPFEQYPLRLDIPPEDSKLNRIVKFAGDAAKAAKRVEVPFEVIAPTHDKYWTWDSRSIVDVPLGRAGATKFQNLKLGKGTSQHMLIAGKTGSGKSTLLHALITNAALMYSPKELELYLIDFKKGVEFKTYAAHHLPHARVIAVESEREFGLSVLQRLDVELKNRGEKYRVVNAQDVASYRRITGKDLPRILLLVDEFQEFFIEDDKLSQESSLLLDRLVRQGRAFGVHVTLGSQTLGGAYSLARTTIAQMAIRIALQCSEADSHLILSEDNAAARLLTRPGEAIYNDANGMIEGNHIFQVVFLTDHKREEYLKEMQALAIEKGMMPDTPQLVFEGNLPAVVDRNPLLNEALAATTWPEEVRAATAWVGDAIAIKDPTNVVFRRQAGSHVLLVGQQDEGALGILNTMLVSLACQHADPGQSGEIANGARFYVFDGSAPDSPNLGMLNKLADVIPHPFKTANYRDFHPLMVEIGEELARRQADDQAEYPSIYLTIFDLGRFRDLRKADDDFGFSSRSSGDEKPKPAKILTDVLREGPNFGIHVIAWCDTVGNLNRTFERSTAGEFELRILFQMSINDSSALIDSPAAGRLGENRGLYFNEEQGKTEKFRPYGLPDQAWLDRAREQLHAKPKPSGWSDAPRPASSEDDGYGDDPDEPDPPSFSSYSSSPGPIKLPPIAPADLPYDDEPEPKPEPPKPEPSKPVAPAGFQAHSTSPRSPSGPTFLTTTRTKPRPREERRQRHREWQRRGQGPRLRPGRGFPPSGS